MIKISLSDFIQIVPIGTTDHRQAVERIARNPYEKDMFIIYQSSVGATENHFIQIVP